MTMCACMGPQRGEPLCPCAMRAARAHLFEVHPQGPFLNGPMNGPATVIPHGCICPPGSEKTCQGLCCPRRGPPSAFGDIEPAPTAGQE